jgi:hypothetical protein
MFHDHRPIGRYPRCAYCARRFDLRAPEAWWHVHGVCVPAPGWRDSLSRHAPREVLGALLAILAALVLLAVVPH